MRVRRGSTNGPPGRPLSTRFFGAGTTYADYAEEKKCPDDGCAQGRVLYNLLDYASKLVCLEKANDAEARRDMRQLAYVFAQSGLYREYLGTSPAGKAATKALDAYLEKVRALPVKGLPAEQLAHVIRVVASIYEPAKQTPLAWTPGLASSEMMRSSSCPISEVGTSKARTSGSSRVTPSVTKRPTTAASGSSGNERRTS